MLSDDEAGRIVRASIHRDRVLSGNNGTPPDVILVEVKQIVRDHVVAALRSAADEFDLYLAENGVCMTCESNAVTATEVWLRARADRIEAGDPCQCVGGPAWCPHCKREHYS